MLTSVKHCPDIDCAGRLLDLSTPAIMGVINTTPDSFSDGGLLYKGGRLDVDRALYKASSMVADGARILDIGGESTRPGAAPVSYLQECDRVLPLLEKICAELDVIVSVDTSTASIMTAAAELGAGMLNDVRALSREGALQAAAESNLPICLMHMRGSPLDMQQSPHYANVVQAVRLFLQQRVAACVEAGIEKNCIILDPGFGFGKTVKHNLQLLQGLPHLSELGFPLLVGFSRKSMIEKLIGRSVDKRLPASLALAVLAVERGAGIIRTHDVAATVDAVAMAVALANEEHYE
ncbi:MAG: dihydropteroate synthase [Halioglobus sp.]